MNKEKILKQFCFKEFNLVGKFMTSTGHYTAVYPDLRLLYSFPRKAKVIIQGIKDRIRESAWNFEVVISPATAGIGWGFALALELDKKFCYYRSQVKAIQTKKKLEGYFQKDERVVIIDDVLSSSKTKKSMVDELDNLGLKTTGILVIWDSFHGSKMDSYFQPKQEWLKDYDYQYLVTWQEVVDYYKRIGFWQKEFCDLTTEMIQNFSTWGKHSENWHKFKELASKETNLIFHKSFKEL